MTEIMVYSQCKGGRQAVALTPLKQPIHKFFSKFNNPKIIKQEECEGLLEEQIKEIYKESAGYFCIGCATQRNKDLMDHATMLVIDGDHGKDELAPLGSVARNLDNLKLTYLIHSSWTQGRWRLILPLLHPIEKKDLKTVGKAFVQKLNELSLDIEYVNENANISQPWFYPVILEGADYTVKRNITTEQLDPLDYLFEEEIKETKKFDKEEGLRKILDAEEVHTTTNQIIMSMLAYGIPAIQVQTTVQGMLLAAKHELEQKGNYSRSKDIDDRIKDLTRSITGAVKKLENKIELPILKEEKVNDFELPWPPGLIGELANHFYERANFPVKEVAICTALGIVAGVGGRTYNINRMGINLYLTLLMRTGMGKDSIQKHVTQILDKFPQGESFLGSKTFTSGKALAQELRTARAKLCVFTEAGFMYRASAGNQESLQRNILDLYTKSGKDDLTLGEKYSSDEGSVGKMRAPSLTIINESTPEIFQQTMLARDANNTGERARMLAFNVVCPKPYMNRNAGPIVLSDRMLNNFQDLFNRSTQNQVKDNPDVLDIPIPEGYYDIMDKYTDRYNLAISSQKLLEATCLTRVYEKVLRLCGVLAAFENPTDPTVSREQFEWALHCIEYELATVYSLTGADSEMSFHQQVIGPQIIRLLKDQGPKHTVNPELHRKYRFTLSSLHVMLQQKAEVKAYLGHLATIKDTMNLVQYFIDIGYLTAPKDIGRNRRVCEVTQSFLNIFNTEE